MGEPSAEPPPFGQGASYRRELLVRYLAAIEFYEQLVVAGTNHRERRRVFVAWRRQQGDFARASEVSRADLAAFEGDLARLCADLKGQIEAEREQT